MWCPKHDSMFETLKCIMPWDFLNRQLHDFEQDKQHRKCMVGCIHSINEDCIEVPAGKPHTQNSSAVFSPQLWVLSLNWFAICRLQLPLAAGNLWSRHSSHPANVHQAIKTSRLSQCGRPCQARPHSRCWVHCFQTAKIKLVHAGRENESGHEQHLSFTNRSIMVLLHWSSRTRISISSFRWYILGQRKTC